MCRDSCRKVRETIWLGGTRFEQNDTRTFDRIFGAFICVMDIFAVINSGFDLTCLDGFLMGGGIL